MEYLILFLPLLASIISGFFGKKLGDKLSEIIPSIFVSISAILSKRETGQFTVCPPFPLIKGIS